MGPKYRFFATIDDYTKQVFPLYGDKTCLVYALEKDQQLFRTSLDGEFKFLKDDFDFIMSKPFDSTIYITIERSVDNGFTYSQYFKGKFERTDCTINETDKILKVSIAPIDGYENIISGLDKEFNLIELAPAIQPVRIHKRAALQIYVTDTEVVTTFVGGTYFESPSTRRYTGEELEDLHFSQLRKITYIKVGSSGTGIGGYEGSYYKISDTVYENIEIRARLVLNNDGSIHLLAASAYGIYDKTVSTDGRIETGLNGSNYIVFTAPRVSDGKVFTYGSSEIDNGLEYAAIYGRVLLDIDDSSIPTYEIPLDDINSSHNNYTRCMEMPASIGEKIIMYTSLASQPTEWGIYQPGFYYVKPKTVEHGEQYYPIGRSAWANFSLWLPHINIGDLVGKNLTKQFTLKHTYALAGCIKVILSKVAPELTFDETPLYSRFFYESVNPLSNDAFRLFITPMTNITRGEYDRPAQKAIITLRNIFNMLKACYKCYWFVDRGRLRIEHVSFFRNGLNYLALADAGIDISDIIEPKTNRPWTTAANSYYFDKLNIPEYLQFKWSDSVSKPFEGYPIEVFSNYIEKGNIEEVNVQKFSSDVDLMLLNPGAFSEDNFAVLAAILEEDIYKLPFLKIKVDGYEYVLQNGLLAFVDLQPKYYTKDLPAKSVKINNSEYVAAKEDIKRSKLQDVKFPVGLSFLNPMQLIKTKIGEGLADNVKINLSSQIAQATLRYDNE